MGVDSWGVKIDTWEEIILKFDFSRLILARFHFGHLFLNWDIYVQNGLSKVESMCGPKEYGFWAVLVSKNNCGLKLRETYKFLK